MATEGEVIKAAENVATDAFTSYLDEAEIKPDYYQKVTGSTVASDAQMAVEDNSDYLKDIADERGGVEAAADAVQNDGETRDMLFDEYTQNFADMEEDYKKQTEMFAEQQVLARITSTLEDDGISDKLMAAAAGLTMSDIAREVAQVMIKEDPSSFDGKEGYVDTPVLDDYITPYEEKAREHASAKVYDNIMEQYKVKDTSPLSRIGNYPTDNCRYASGLISLEAYIEKNLPEINSED